MVFRWRREKVITLSDESKLKFPFICHCREESVYSNILYCIDLVIYLYTVSEWKFNFRWNILTYLRCGYSIVTWWLGSTRKNNKYSLNVENVHLDRMQMICNVPWTKLLCLYCCSLFQNSKPGEKWICCTKCNEWYMKNALVRFMLGRLEKIHHFSFFTSHKYPFIYLFLPW